MEKSDVLTLNLYSVLRRSWDILYDNSLPL